VEKANVNEQGNEFSRGGHRLQTLRWDHKGKSPESAAISFFRAPRAHDVVPPLIIKYCTLYPEDIQELFSLYVLLASFFFEFSFLL